MTRGEAPRFRIWVPGKPRSANGGARSRYREAIANAARQVIERPIGSSDVDIEVWFGSDAMRPDVDNILKPVLDALKGVAYRDDCQVRSVRVVAIPHHRATHIPIRAPIEVVQRLGGRDEFLIAIFEGRSLPAGRL